MFATTHPIPAETIDRYVPMIRLLLLIEQSCLAAYPERELKRLIRKERLPLAATLASIRHYLTWGNPLQLACSCSEIAEGRGYIQHCRKLGKL